MRFAELTAPELHGLPRDRTLVLAPIAACEQHGPHLPVFTDSILCAAVAEGVEARRPDRVLLLPVLWLGASEHHLPFGGTLTATLPTYQTLLVELLRPLLRDGFTRALVVNGHGGNTDPLRVALRRLDSEFPRARLAGAAYWDMAEPELAALCRGPRTVMGHACELETSMMLHLRPDLVRSERIADDPDETPGSLRGTFWARDFSRRTHHGVIGHPESASAASGEKMLQASVARVVAVADQLLDPQLA